MNSKPREKMGKYQHPSNKSHSKDLWKEISTSVSVLGMDLVIYGARLIWK